ncbi:hypothetical protein [Butyrivibrio sp. XBB1001]|uniref:hypothetical protein n=1 Tax=Butyrivibrio sp. XBB1001 TaxID=1280682 RepID=UPI00041A3BD7|nr:hypothetical protein [Butyrivibrio sp. XBB1001]
MDKRIIEYFKIVLIGTMAFLLMGCGTEKKTYADGLKEGFETGYTEGIFDYDCIAAKSGKTVVYADKYGYLTGYHDGIVGNNRLSEIEHDNKQLLDAFVAAYEQGYTDAVDGKDSLDDYSYEHRWHSVTTDNSDMDG